MHCKEEKNIFDVKRIITEKRREIFRNLDDFKMTLSIYLYKVTFRLSEFSFKYESRVFSIVSTRNGNITNGYTLRKGIFLKK